MNQNEVQDAIKLECDQIKELLLTKNKNYGNSALEPQRIFSSANPEEQLKVRIDDKLSRIANFTKKGSLANDGDDAVKDLIGYLILLRISQNQAKDFSKI